MRPHTAGNGRSAAGALARISGDDEATLTDKLRLLETDRKSFFESSQSEIKRNREEIRRLREENSDLKTTIAATKKTGGSGTTGPSILDKERDQLDHAIYVSTLKLDKLRDDVTRHRALVDEELHKLTAIETESEPLLTGDSYLTRRIRMLENRLDKSLIKYNEAVAIKKTYEHIVMRLREERVGFDHQLAAIEKTLSAKDHDYQELLQMSHAANHAKELAKKDLQDFKASFDDERKQKDRELAERKLFVQTKVDQTQKLEKKEKSLRQREVEEARGRAEEEAGRGANKGANASNFPITQGLSPEEEERLSQYESAFKAIKEATGVKDVNDLLVKYLSQEETHRNLEATSRESQHRIDDLNVEKAELTAKLEELRYTGSGQLGSRRIVEEFELHLAEAGNQTESNGARYEQLAKLLIDVRAGMDHLLAKLGPYRAELPMPASVSEENILEALGLIEQKLQAIAEEVVPSDGTEEALITTTVELPQYNRRVKVMAMDDQDDEGAAADVAVDEADDDAVLKRDQVKKISANSIQRETKKLRKRKPAK